MWGLEARGLAAVAVRKGSTLVAHLLPSGAVGLLLSTLKPLSL